MSTTPIDYEALARQHGAIDKPKNKQVDYAALAKQNGAVDSEPAQETVKEQPGPVSRFFSNIVGDPSKDVEGFKNKRVAYLGEQGLNAVKSLNPLPAMQDTYQSAVSGWKTPVPGESTLGMIDRKIGAAGRYIESGVPYLGPALAHASGQFESGDVAGGTGSSIQLGLGAVAGDPNVRAAVPRTIKSMVPTPANIWHGVDRVALGSEPPAQILTRALKPPVTYPEFEDVVGRRLPEIVQESKASGKPILGVRDFGNVVDTLADKKNTQYQNLISPFRQPTATVNGRSVPAVGPFRPANIDASPVADAQVASIPPLDLLERPNKQSFIQRGGRQVPEGDRGILEKTQDLASTFRREMPIGQLDAIRVDSNAKLNSFYNQAKGDQHAALSNPETARTKAINDTSRDLVYDRLEKETGVNPRPIQDAFGDFTDLGNVAGKRATVYSRQQPFPLQEQVNAADALAHGNPVKFGMSKLFSRYGNSDELTQIALDRFIRNPMPSKVPVPGQFPNSVVGSIAASMRKKRDEDEK